MSSSPPLSPRTPERDSNPIDDFSIIEVTKTSPEKYRIHGIQSDDEDEEYFEDDIVALLAKEQKIEGIALQVKFKNPRTDEYLIQTVPLSKYTWSKDRSTLHCIFDLENSTPILFRANLQANFSTIRIVYKPEKKEERVVRIYSTYQCDVEKQLINSENGRLKSTFRILTKDEQKKLFPKPKTARKLFSDETEQKPYEIHVENKSIRFGGVVVLTHIEVDLKRDLY